MKDTVSTEPDERIYAVKLNYTRNTTFEWKD